MTFTNILWGMFGGSVFFRTIKNWAADNKIKRQGFMITSDPRSIIERIISFIKENFYHIVPVYNILHSLRIFISNDEEYANKRFVQLSDKERIKTASSVEIEEPKVEVTKEVKDDLLDETNNEVKALPPRRTNTETKTLPEVKTPTLEEQLEYYRNMDRQLRNRHAKLIELHDIKGANEVGRKIREVDNKYNEIKSLIKSNEIKLVRTNKKTS